jgi:queuine tRNA-ribosyltransferase
MNQTSESFSDEVSFSVTQSEEYPYLRAGALATAHGLIHTPTYMPVGTYGPVRLLDAEELWACGAEIVLGNALHLHMNIGAERIESFGGLARFTGWGGPTLTDSGGYQVSYWWKSGTHSLEGNERKHRIESPVEKITDEGVRVRSLVNGDRFWITPESAVEVQAKIGADIIMAFDQPTFDTDSLENASSSLTRSHAWVERSFGKWRELKSNHSGRPSLGASQAIRRVLSRIRHARRCHCRRIDRNRPDDFCSDSGLNQRSCPRGKSSVRDGAWGWT